MLNFDPTQLITVSVFLLALIVVQLVVKRMSLVRGQGVSRSMKVIETLPLGPKDRAILLSVGEQRFLVCVGKNGASAPTAVNAVVSEDEI